MNTLTIANPAQTPSPTQSAGASAAATGPEADSDGDLDFAGLLGAGIGRTAGRAQARESVEIAKDPVTGTSSDTPSCDPAALLDAIAAGQANVDPQQLPVAQIAVQPMPPSLAPVDATAPAKPNDASALAMIARDSAPSVRARTEGGKSMPLTDSQKPASSPRTTDAPHQADARPPVTIAQAAAHEPAAIPVPKTELPERQPEPASLLPTVGATPSHAAAPSPPAIAARVVAHVEQLAQPFGSHAWEDGFSSRVVWMARNDVQSAEIRLNPPDLGPIEVKLVMTHDQGSQASASVQFSATHAATREAIESALPRLREMLQENGIALGNTTVDARTAGNTNGSADSGRWSHGGSAPDAHPGQTPEPAIQPSPGSLVRRGNGLVDTFA